MCLAHEISQSRRTPQATRAVHEFSHNATLRVAKVSRKLAGAAYLSAARGCCSGGCPQPQIQIHVCAWGQASLHARRGRWYRSL